MKLLRNIILGFFYLGKKYFKSEFEEGASIWFSLIIVVNTVTVIELANFVLKKYSDSNFELSKEAYFVTLISSTFSFGFYSFNYLSNSKGRLENSELTDIQSYKLSSIAYIIFSIFVFLLVFYISVPSK